MVLIKPSKRKAKVEKRIDGLYIKIPIRSNLNFPFIYLTFFIIFVSFVYGFSLYEMIKLDVHFKEDFYFNMFF